jgi:hypothetical protein
MTRTVMVLVAVACLGHTAFACRLFEACRLLSGPGC